MTISITRVIYVALAALIAVAIWVLMKSSTPVQEVEADPSAVRRKPRTRYAELVAARRDVERQIEQLERRGGYTRSSEFSNETLVNLRAIRDQIETELSELKASQ
jgi:cell division protein FtsB